LPGRAQNIIPSMARVAFALNQCWLWRVQGCPPLPSWLLGPGHTIAWPSLLATVLVLRFHRSKATPE
jgi:hypothetical protein